MSSDTTETPLASSIIVSDITSSTDIDIALTTKSIKKTARDQFFSNINIVDKNKSWEATCDICKSIIRGTNGVTSNYNRHIKELHKSTYELWQEKLQSINLTGRKKITDTLPVQKIKYSSSSIYQTHHPRQVELQKSIVEDLIIELGLPLSLIERPGFIKFMTYVDPRFSVISRRTLTRTILPDLHTKMVNNLKTFCSMVPFMSLTLDLWSDKRQRAFFALTGHAIIDSEFKSYMSFEPIFGNHRAPLLLQTYENCINDFNIQSKLVRLITDSCSNNIAAFSGLIIPGFESYFQNDDKELYSDLDSDDEKIKLDDTTNDNNVQVEIDDALKHFLDSIIIDDESFRLPCYAHTLQLTVKDCLKGLTGIQSSLEKVSGIAKLSHSSTVIAERFENIKVCIPRANKTRWNSQYDMVVNIVGIPASDLNDILIQTQHRELCLKPLDYQMLNEFVAVLALFAEATIISQAPNTPSISIVAPSILTIYHDLLLERQHVKHASVLCENLFESLLARFGDPVFLLAPFLDGRFRLEWISSSSLPEQIQEELSNKIQQLVLEQCILLEHGNRPSAPSSNDNSTLIPTTQTQSLPNSATSSPTTPKRKYLFTNIDNKETKKIKSEPFNYIKDEVFKYLHEDTTDSMFLLRSSSLDNYPTLFKLAMKILSIPVTSAAVERVFSQSGFLFRQHRQSMTRTTLQQLTMLKCNRGLL